LISAHEISFKYPGGVDALSDISADVGCGEMVGVVGPNGSGKTTLVKVLAGLIAPSSGRVVVDGRHLGEYSVRERSRRIAYVAQDTLIPFPYTAFEIVLMGRSPYLKAMAFEDERDRAIARRAMEQTEVAAYADRCIQELSGGERQRVVLARALAQDPRIMLLDEPTASLDIGHTVSFYRLLRERCRDGGLAVVAVMHDVNLAALVCDRVVLLKAGSVVSTGRPADILTADILGGAFETDVRVRVDELTGRPSVMPLFD
jgi:iron complex transport system ATP-binding protein